MMLEIRIVVRFGGAELMARKLHGESTGAGYNLCPLFENPSDSYDLCTVSSICFTLIVYLKKKIGQSIEKILL